MEREHALLARILVVADPEATLPEHAPDLIQAGFTVSVIHPNEWAIRQDTKPTWDAVVIELEAIESAIALVGELYQQWPHLTTILLTPPQPDFVIAAGLHAGAYDWLLKPFDLHLFQAALMRAHERRVLREQRGATNNTPSLSISTHDINNQLSGILGLAQLHLLDPDLPDDLYSDLEEIVASARRITDLLQSKTGA